MKRSKSESVFNIFNIIFNCIFLLMLVVPVLFIVKRSFDAANQLTTGAALFPARFSLVYYRTIFQDSTVFRPFLNSAIITVFGTALSVAMNAMGAYSLSHRELPGNKLFMFMIIFSMMFSGGLVPSYLLMKYLGLINTYRVLIIPPAVIGIHLILFKNYYQSIPAELKDSARIDGAEEFTLFRKIILPLSAPIIAAITLFTAVGYWNTFFTAIIYVNSPKMHPFTVKLQEIIIEQQEMMERVDRMAAEDMRGNLDDESLASAIIVVSTIPIIIIYPFLQKYFTKGIMMGSIKS